MKIIISMFILLTSFNVLASDMAFQGGLGMQNGAVHIVADIDFQKQSSHSFGGFFVFGSEKDSVRGQFWSLGGDVKVFFGPNDWKVYLAPGLAVISFDSVGGATSETTFGTVFKAGTLLEVAFDMYAGLEFMYLQNWFSDKTFGGTYFLTNATFRMDF